MVSRRVRQVARTLQRAISQVILTELKDPRIGFVTVTKVEPSPDLRRAQVSLSVMGDEKAERLTLAALRHAAGYIQTVVSDRLHMRCAPVLEFRVDQSVKGTLRVSQLLEEDRREQPGYPEGPASGREAPADE